MFSIFKKSSPVNLDLSSLGTDMHAHFLPGIDDGAPDTGASLTLLKGLIEMGFQHVIPTPHIYADLYPNTRSSIQQAVESLNKALQAAQWSAPIRSAAAEYLLDPTVIGRLERKEALLTVSGKKVLVEFSFTSLPLSWKEDLFQLQIAGYEPILAHPERYLYLDGNRNIFHTVADMGIAMQVNLLSFTGYYHKTATVLAEYLLKQGLISYLGTDIHHERHLQAFYQGAKPIMQALDTAQQRRPLLNAAL
jgi:tyrosine-protein phosphatase YwqE